MGYLAYKPNYNLPLTLQVRIASLRDPQWCKISSRIVWEAWVYPFGIVERILLRNFNCWVPRKFLGIEPSC